VLLQARTFALVIAHDIEQNVDLDQRAVLALRRHHVVPRGAARTIAHETVCVTIQHDPPRERVAPTSPITCEIPAGLKQSAAAKHLPCSAALARARALRIREFELEGARGGARALHRYRCGGMSLGSADGPL
jgi:hypothetical protein